MNDMAAFRTVRSLVLRTRNIFRGEKLDRDLDEELAAHLDLHITDNLRSGMSPAEARRHALLKLGGLQQTRENYRERAGLPLFERFLRNLRYSARKLWKNPIFTLVVVLTMALGIAANTTIFSMVNALLLRPYRFHDLDSLVLVWENRGTDEGFDSRWISPGDAADVTNDTLLFQDVAKFDCRHFNLSSEGRIDAVRGCRVSTNFFRLLGVTPAQGRLFSPDESRPGFDQVVVVSHTFWQSRFAGDPNFLGKAIRLSGRNYTVVGIMPPGFTYPVPRELWVPLALNPAQDADRSQLSLAALARLRPGVTVSRAQAELAALSRRLSESFPATNAGRVFSLLQLRKELYLYTLPLFLLLQAAAVFLLLLACANLANLFFARIISRQRELAIQSSLGAGPLHLSHLLTTELLFLVLLGGLAALAVSSWAVRLLRDSISTEWTKWVPGWDAISLDANVLIFAILLSAALALLFGLATTLHLRRVDLNRALKEGGRGATPSRGRFRNALVCAQVALGLVLLVCAVLTMQGFHRLAAVYQGFQPDHVWKFEVGLPDGSYTADSAANNFFQRALASVSTLPGVTTAALASNLPASNVESDKTLFTIEGRPAASLRETPEASLQTISGDYFSVLKIPLIAGRFLANSDNSSAAGVVIINQSMANLFWPAGDALGKRLKLGASDSPNPWVTIIGIVGDARQNWWQSITLPVIYRPYLQAPYRTLDFIVRVASGPAVYASSVNTLFSQLDPEIAVTEMNTLRSEVDDSIAIVRIMGILMAIFGLVALLLCAVGLYGILSENIAQRTNEFGIRLALGALPSTLLRLILRHALTLTSVGLAVGLPLAFLVSQTMATLVFGVVSVSLPALGGLAVLLLIVAMAVACIPARRATGIDPMTALRYE